MPAESRVHRLLSYFGSLKDSRTHFEDMWQEISDNSLGRADFTTIRDPGRDRMVRIYDTTSRDSSDLLTAALHSLLTNPATNWFDIRWMDDELNDIEEAIYYLADIQMRMKAAFTRPVGGFATQIAEVYSDLNGFGTGTMFTADDPAFGPRFMSRPLSETFIDVDHTKRVASIFRRFELQNWVAVQQFGPESVPQVAKKNEKDPNGTSEFLHHVRKREAPLPGNLDASGMAWESIYLSMKDKSIAREGGFHENPYQVARWRVDSGELYGRGPGTSALPEQKMLNSIWRTFIRSVEKAVDPPILVDDEGVMPGSQVNVTPSAQIVVRNDGNPREPVRYLESRSQLRWSVELIESRSKKIEKAFHSEIIQAFQDPRMTATQVIELARLSQRILSPVLGRMQVELLDPLIKRVYGIISRQPDFPVPPEILEGRELRLEYVSPVARAQKASEAQAIMDSFAAAAAIAEINPDVMDNIDTDEAVRSIFEGNGTPVRILRPRPDVIEVRAMNAKIQEEERQRQELLQGGDTVAKLLPGIASLNEAPGGAAP